MEDDFFFCNLSSGLKTFLQLLLNRMCDQNGVNLDITANITEYIFLFQAHCLYSRQTTCDDILVSFYDTKVKKKESNYISK